MKKPALHILVAMVGVVFSLNALSQSRLFVPFQRQSNLPVQHSLDTIGSAFHADVYPYLTSDVKESEYYKNIYEGAFFADKFFLELNLNKDSETTPIKLSLSPVGELQAGFEAGFSNNPFYQTGIGVNASAVIGNKLDVNVNIMGSNSSFPFFTQQFIYRNKVVPGQGWANQSDLGYFYNNSNGYVSYSPGKYFNLTVGRGKNKFGSGYRSLLLSDIGDNYNYFKITTTIWRFKYTNLYAQYDDIYNVPGAPDVTNKKYSAAHYLSINIGKRWSVGLYESIQWMGNDSAYNRGFDVNYLNPIIFLRPVEFSMGSADNALMGLNLSFKASNSVKLYGQLILDEFKLSEMTSGNGWWANKYGIQAGVKYYNAFNIDRLTLQGEINRVRPYTYSHRSSAQAYGYFNQPLAHPSGANFNEGVFLANYYKNKVYVELKATVIQQGVDFENDTVSYGANIFESYDQRPSDYGVEIGQGQNRLLSTLNLKASYLVSAKGNIRVEANISGHNETIGNDSRNIFWARIGILTGIFNEDWDF